MIPRVLALVLLAVAAHVVPLKPQKDCELWVGSASGNDPSVRVELQLCPRGDGGLAGELQWSSSKSGWNRRAVSGGYRNESKSAITLKDERFIENQPNWPWRFCLIDEYRLTRTGQTLSGEYDSAACRDHATLSLQKAAKSSK